MAIAHAGNLQDRTFSIVTCETDDAAFGFGVAERHYYNVAAFIERRHGSKSSAVPALRVYLKKRIKILCRTLRWMTARNQTA